MTFSFKLEQEILAVITEYNAERGCEEIVGDNLSDENLKEFNDLVDEHGFEVVTEAIKSKFHL